MKNGRVREKFEFELAKNAQKNLLRPDQTYRINLILARVRIDDVAIVAAS